MTPTQKRVLEALQADTLELARRCRVCHSVYGYSPPELQDLLARAIDNEKIYSDQIRRLTQTKD